MLLCLQRHVLESKLDGQLFAEFEQIAKRRLKSESVVATLERNREQNRFKDVVPYDDNRVSIMPSETNADGYINASHIKVSSHVLLADTFYAGHICLVSIRNSPVITASTARSTCSSI